MVNLVDTAAGDLLILISCILLGHEIPLVGIQRGDSCYVLVKTLFKRYQLLLYLL